MCHQEGETPTLSFFSVAGPTGHIPGSRIFSQPICLEARNMMFRIRSSPWPPFSDFDKSWALDPQDHASYAMIPRGKR
jgi:hypothetical protein